jgi:hypothetical protein
MHDCIFCVFISGFVDINKIILLFVVCIIKTIYQGILSFII